MEIVDKIETERDSDRHPVKVTLKRGGRNKKERERKREKRVEGMVGGRGDGII